MPGTAPGAPIPAYGAGVISPSGAGQSVFYDSALRARVNIFMPYASGTR
jgi:hypothetical protein